MTSANRFLDLPHDLQGLIWQSYFRHHVAPCVRSAAISGVIRRRGIHLTTSDLEEDFDGLISHGELAGLSGVLWWFCPLLMQPFYFHERNTSALIGSVGYKHVFRGEVIDDAILVAQREDYAARLAALRRSELHW